MGGYSDLGGVESVCPEGEWGYAGYPVRAPGDEGRAPVYEGTSGAGDRLAGYPSGAGRGANRAQEVYEGTRGGGDESGRVVEGAWGLLQLARGSLEGAGAEPSGRERGAHGHWGAESVQERGRVDRRVRNERGEGALCRLSESS